MSTRLAAAFWLLLGVAVWNGFYDLYVSRGAREYGQLRVEAELGRGVEPDMTQLMARARRDGAVAATLWAVLIVMAGWGTIALVARRRT